VSLNVHGKYNLLNILIMKKSILNLGKALNKAEQKEINGGIGIRPVYEPCGDTGGMPVSSAHCGMGTYGTQWYNGVCYACY
jgi:hypothetical protein